MLQCENEIGLHFIHLRLRGWNSRHFSVAEGENESVVRKGNVVAATVKKRKNLSRRGVNEPFLSQAAATIRYDSTVPFPSL